MWSFATMKPEECSLTIIDEEKSGIRLVRTSALRACKELIVGLGGDPAALFRKFEIEQAILDHRSSVIPYRTMAQLLECASVELTCPDFGMRLALVQCGTNVLDPLYLVMRNSPTLGQAFRYSADHVQAYSAATQICFEKLADDSRVFVRFEILLERLSHQRQAVEFALMGMQRAALAISGGQIRAREVWFTHEPLAAMSIYRANFDATLRFGQSMNGLIFNEQELDRSVPDTDQQLYEAVTGFIDHRFPIVAIAISTRVRSIIARLLVEGNCTPERVASTLGLHPRTMQRRLRDQGESFEVIKDGVRRDVALRYLQDAHVPLVRVTEILGYSETSVLTRSCRRWFSASPRQLRSELSRENQGIG
jgi:AraC-like DNA-binding protein